MLRPETSPDNKIDGANMGLIWGRQDSGGQDPSTLLSRSNNIWWHEMYFCRRALQYMTPRMLFYIYSSRGAETISTIWL